MPENLSTATLPKRPPWATPSFKIERYIDDHVLMPTREIRAIEEKCRAEAHKPEEGRVKVRKDLPF